MKSIHKCFLAIGSLGKYIPHAPLTMFTAFGAFEWDFRSISSNLICFPEAPTITMMEENCIQRLRSQGYHLIGSHSAVKSCHWLRKALRGEGGCYKQRFYGIRSHRCIQMTPMIYCNHSCLHCWRPIELRFPIPVKLDPPEWIVDQVIKEQRQLISGFLGNPHASRKMIFESLNPNHVAISLIGEPCMYPELPRLIQEFHSRGFSSFLVTNGSFPEMISRANPTQLYLSLNAPNRELHSKICSRDDWDLILESLEQLARAKSRTRTVIRITAIHGLNMVDPKGYAELISIANPDFLEIKAYMHLGFSRYRLSSQSMPSHQQIMEFGEKIAVESGYAILDDSPVSRAVLLGNRESSPRFIAQEDGNNSDDFELEFMERY